MKSHSTPSLLSIAAVLIAALVVAIAFGVSTDSPSVQAQQATPIDYDDDDNGLIDIKNRAQLDAVRYDRNGDGTATGDKDGAYPLAFPNPKSGMGCAENNGGGCTGYELTENVVLGETPWVPIAKYGAVFDGNGNTISGLTIDAANGKTRFGLFAEINNDGEVRNLGLIAVNITVTPTSTAVVVDAGGLAGQNFGIVSGSYVTGVQIVVTRDGNGGTSNVGGLVGWNDAKGTITASYAAVDVSADVSATASKSFHANAGGLVGFSGGTIKASYATGEATAAASGAATATAGGLVGLGGSATITASYSTGVATATVPTGQKADSAKAGGLVGGGTVTSTVSYWDTDTSNATTTALNQGVGKSTADLQAPITYDGIFANWNIDVDDDAAKTNDDPWDFGGDWQYPVLRYGKLVPSDQRAQVTLTLSATSTPEGGTVTLNATLEDISSSQDTVVKLTASAGASLSAETVTIKAGETKSANVTVTAAATVLAANAVVKIEGKVQPGGSGADKPSPVTLTIIDDEPIVVGGVEVRARATLVVVSWDALDGADGYTVEWTSVISRGVPNWTGAGAQDVSGTSTTVRRLSPGTDYQFRVSATNMDESWSAAVEASTEGEDDGLSPFATMTPTPTPTPVATPIPATVMISTSTAATLMSADGQVTLEFPAGSRSEPYQVNIETETGCAYAGAKTDVTFTCVTVKIFDSEDMLETGVELDAPATLTFRLTAEQVDALGGEFLLTKLDEMGGLIVITRASAANAWTTVPSTLAFDDETGGATLTASISSFSTFTAVVLQATYDAVQETYGHLLPRDTLTPPTGGPSLPGIALLALLLGSVALLAAGWIMTARRSGA